MYYRYKNLIIESESPVWINGVQLEEAKLTKKYFQSSIGVCKVEGSKSIELATGKELVLPDYVTSQGDAIESTIGLIYKEGYIWTGSFWLEYDTSELIPFRVVDISIPEAGDFDFVELETGEVTINRPGLSGIVGRSLYCCECYMSNSYGVHKWMADTLIYKGRWINYEGELKNLKLSGPPKSFDYTNVGHKFEIDGITFTKFSETTFGIKYE